MNQLILENQQLFDEMIKLSMLFYYQSNFEEDIFYINLELDY
ncbi:hypothetical protein CP01DC11_1284 [Chlamydia psittaci 01DC11]|nr:hypothetical protein CP01DC11_1284 [Chlamydia psittaci 01DC11]